MRYGYICMLCYVRNYLRQRHVHKTTLVSYWYTWHVLNCVSMPLYVSCLYKEYYCTSGRWTCLYAHIVWSFFYSFLLHKKLQISVARGISAVVGLLSTFTFRPLTKCTSVPRAGLIGIWEQVNECNNSTNAPNVCDASTYVWKRLYISQAIEIKKQWERERKREAIRREGRLALKSLTQSARFCLSI